MSGFRRTMLVILTMVACAGCDQVSKAVAKSALPSDRVITFAGDTVRLRLTENSGAFLSIGASLPARVRSLVFTVGVGVIVGALALLAIVDARGGAVRAVALALVAGGGLSNVLDRVAYGGNVIDFLNVGVGSVRTGIFNLADVAVMAGAVLLLSSVRRAGRNV